MRLSYLLACSLVLAEPQAALAWGDEGHEVVALIAEHYLEPGVRDRVEAMLAADIDPLTAHDIASEATWADRDRDSDRQTTRERYNQTHRWHFVDLELDGPDRDAACFGRPALPPGTVASRGPAADCIIDKITQFTLELAAPATDPEERLVALKFLLHLVGDIHQPLHAADHHDAGGNRISVTAEGARTGSLHHYWDVEFVKRLGPGPKEIADRLIRRITAGQAAEWAGGGADDWAQESFELARAQVYRELPSTSNRLDAAYLAEATVVAGEQLSKAGLRLSALLNRALRSR